MVNDDDRMPNGLQSYAETLCEMCFNVYHYCRVQHPEYDDGNNVLREVAMELTDEFEKKFKGQDWEQLEWYAEIDAFFFKWLVACGWEKPKPVVQNHEGICLAW